MAARTKSKAKDAASDGPEAAAKASGRKAAAKAAPGAKKTAAAGKGRGKAPAAKRASKASVGDERQMLIEQNEALRAELEAARARIAQLEKVHGDVIDRIDWVIDSLQTALEEKG